MVCVSKYGLLAVNFFVICLGLAVTGVAGAVLRQESVLGIFLTNVFYSVPLCALLGGVFITFLGVLGCWGAVKQSACMLKTYAAIVSVLLVGVVLVGVTIIVFLAGSSSYLVVSMTSLYNQYGGEDQKLTHDIDVAQNVLHCCGIYSYKDWQYFTYGNYSNVADGCCKNQTEGCGVDLLQDPNVEDLVYTTGCMAFIIDAFDAICITLTVLTLSMAGIQFLSIVWACNIAKNAVRYQKV